MIDLKKSNAIQIGNNPNVKSHVAFQKPLSFARSIFISAS